MKAMKFLLNFNPSIVVPICTEWLTLHDFSQLESCSESIQKVLISLEQKYSSRFRLLLDADVVVPISMSNVKWFKRHLLEWNILHEFTETTLTMLKGKVYQKFPIISWLMPWMMANSSLVTCLKSVKRMKVNINSNLSEDEILFLRDSGKNLRELHIKNSGNMSKFFWDNVPCISKLVTLQLSQAPESMCLILRQAVNLQCLHIECPFSDLTIVRTMVLYCRCLTSLRIQTTQRIARRDALRTFLIIAFHCAKLFTDFQCPLIDRRLLKSLLVHRCGPQLTSLVCYPKYRYCEESERFVEDIAELTPQLISFTPFDEFVSVSLLTTIQSRFTQLKVLDLQHCRYSVEEDVVQMLLTQCPQISEIYLKQHYVSDNTFISLWINKPVITSRIKHLSMFRCTHLTDATLLCLPQLCSVLTSLDLRELQKITDSGLLALLQTGRLQQLKISNTSLTDATLLNIAEYCYDLRELFLNGVKYTVKSLLELVRCCLRLKGLYCDSSYADSMGDMAHTHSLITTQVMTINPRIFFGATLAY